MCISDICWIASSFFLSLSLPLWGFSTIWTIGITFSGLLVESRALWHVRYIYVPFYTRTKTFICLITRTRVLEDTRFFLLGTWNEIFLWNLVGTFVYLLCSYVKIHRPFWRLGTTNRGKESTENRYLGKVPGKMVTWKKVHG